MTGRQRTRRALGFGGLALAIAGAGLSACGNVETGRGPASGEDGGAPMLVIRPVQFLGDRVVEGTVELASTEPGLTVTMEIRSPTPFGDRIERSEEIDTTDAGIVQFRIEGISDGMYVLELKVDATSDGFFDLPGDLRGYYEGTAEHPIQEREEATLYRIAGEPEEPVTFGAGVIEP